MTRQEAKDKGLTHSGTMFGFIPVYLVFLGGEDFEAVGKSKFYDGLLHILTEIDMFFHLGFSFGIWMDWEKL